MRMIPRASVLILLALVLPSLAEAVDIWTVGVNNTRQGWNQSETILTAANVPGLKKIHEFQVDEKMDTSPLVVGNRLYVFTMTNTAFVFDVNTGAQLAKRQLAPPFDPSVNTRPNGYVEGLPQLGNFSDASNRCNNEHDLRHDVRKTKRRQSEHRTQ